MENEQIQDLFSSRKVLEMLTVANDFCMFLEKAEDYSREEILIYLQKVIPLIYIKSSLLPDIPVNDEGFTEHFVTEEQWENLFNALHQKFGEDDIYYFINHHEKSHSEAIMASIAENVTDIYQDLKDFILLYQKPLVIYKENAVRDLKQLFESHTGFRLVNAHNAIHYLLFAGATDNGYSDLSDLE